MMFTENVWLDFTLAGSLLISWLALAMALLCYARLRKQAGLTQKLYQRLEHNLQVANSGSIGMGKRLLDMERRLTTAGSSVPTAAPASVFKPLLDPDLADAARLIESGLAPDEVARRCGLSRTEASLMQLMHAQVQRVQAA